MATWDDDAGTGGDVAGEWSEGLLLSPGMYTGGVDDWAGDPGDWYLVGVPAGEFLRLTVTGSIEGTIEFRTLSGGTIAIYTHFGTFEMISSEGGVRFGLGGRGDYTLAVGMFEAPDLGVQSLRATSRNVTVQETSTPLSGLDWNFEVDVANLGPGHGTGSLELWAEGRSGTDPALVGTKNVSLSEGAESTIFFEWSSVGSVGDVRIRARLHAPHDPQPMNNEQTYAISFFIGGTGHGFVPAPPNPPPAPPLPVPSPLEVEEDHVGLSASAEGVGGSVRIYPTYARLHACAWTPVIGRCQWLP